MKWIFIVPAALVAVVASAWLIGLMLPKGHIATRTVELKRSPDAVWEMLTSYDKMPSWRAGLQKIERLPDANGHAVWRETSKDGELPLETVESTPPRRLVRKIADPKLPFGGTWTYQIQPSSEGCTLTVTEDGEVYNPIFRLVSKFMNQAATIEGFLKSLESAMTSARS
jgi:uncharacterized protein YndB with AHSA1/START domain